MGDHWMVSHFFLSGYKPDVVFDSVGAHGIAGHLPDGGERGFVVGVDGDRSKSGAEGGDYHWAGSVGRFAGADSAGLAGDGEISVDFDHGAVDRGDYQCI